MIKPINKYFHDHHGITTVLAKLLKPHNNHIHTGRYLGQVQFRTCKANIHENEMKPEIKMIKLYERFNPSIKVCDITSALYHCTLWCLSKVWRYMSLGFTDVSGLIHFVGIVPIILWHETVSLYPCCHCAIQPVDLMCLDPRRWPSETPTRSSSRRLQTL